MAAALAIMLLAPMPPLLFMGEEWDSERPFPFFCDFQGSLAEAVRAGRRKEFRHDYECYADDIPDPLAEDTFRSAKLDWDTVATARGRSRLELVRNAIGDPQGGDRAASCWNAVWRRAAEGQTLSAHWLLGNRHHFERYRQPVRPRAALPESRQHRAADLRRRRRFLAPYAVHWTIGGK